MSTAPTMAPETHAFQAEIRQLLDIVIHSLYTNREIFVRELISNAADALEKFRHQTLVSSDLPEKDRVLDIAITVDPDKKTFEIADTGIGMTREELAENLGTIAHSGTKSFFSRLAEEARRDVSLIGQFGVGFYSAFMVAKRVTVRTRSYHSDSQGWRWESDGTGTYTISPDDEAARGTTITLELRDDAEEFAKDWKIKEVIRKFSAFVSFPVSVQGEKVNTVGAIWTRSKSDVKDEEYDEFFKFLSNMTDGPRYRLHFSADAPLSINALLFVPKDNFEHYGLGRMKPGVDLYCRRVLIMKHPEDLLPEWMRFARGVVESEDLPLNISRETLQDSALIRKLSKVIVGKFLRFLGEQAEKDPEAYAEFHDRFGMFLKEGAAQDFQHREELAKLLRFESSAIEPGKRTSLADYVARMKEGQTDIYYINGASRAAIESGPYLEAFRARGIEVIYTLENIDDFVMNHLSEFDGKPLVSADRGDLKLPGEAATEGEPLSQEETDALLAWLRERFTGRVRDVKASDRLLHSPAAATTDAGLTSAMHRVMMAMNREGETPAPFLTLEINPRSPLIHRISTLRTQDAEFAATLADQLHDNALLAAGLLTDPRNMVERLNTLLARAAGA